MIKGKEKAMGNTARQIAELITDMHDPGDVAKLWKMVKANLADHYIDQAKGHYKKALDYAKVAEKYTPK